MILLLVLVISIVPVHGTQYETLTDFLQTFKKATVNQPTSSPTPLINNNDILVSTNKNETASSSNVKNLMVVVLEIAIVVLLLLLKLLHKVANNGCNFKSSWFKVKSVNEYRQRFYQRQIQQHTILDMIEFINEQSTTNSTNMSSITNSSQPIYAISNV